MSQPQQQPPMPGQTITPPAQPTDELTRRIGDALNEVLLRAQEVSLELATLECDKNPSCPLVKTVRELVKSLKKLFEISRTVRA